MTATSSPRARERTVHQTDGVAWLARARLAAGHAIVTSLPDHSELPELGFVGWRRWFVDTAELICRQVADDDVAIFFQTDVKHDGRWVDKGFLVALGAERAQVHCLWHKVVCRVAPGTTIFGRPAYAHLLCMSRARRLLPAQATPDVLARLGDMPWPRAMGVDVCRTVAAFLARYTQTHTVVDPFCGQGTMLAAANEAGFDAIGVELSRRRAQKARRFTLEPI